MGYVDYYNPGVSKNLAASAKILDARKLKTIKNHKEDSRILGITA
jgi:hypothetical protein